MFLETYTLRGREHIRCLYTPFGGVSLSPNGCSDREWGEFSGDFLQKMDWEILQCVTSEVACYFYFQDNHRFTGPWNFSDGRWGGLGMPSNLFLIQRLGNVNLIHGEVENLVVFPSVVLSDEQQEKDKESMTNAGMAHMYYTQF